MRQSVYSSAVVAGGSTSLQSNSCMERVILHQPFLASENYTKWATRWWRPHPSAVAYTVLPKLALQSAVKVGQAL